MDIQHRIGSRIKELRIQKEFSQEALAWKSNINRTYMNHVENGRKNISIGSLEKIIGGLEISYKEFFANALFETATKKKKKG